MGSRPPIALLCPRATSRSDPRTRSFHGDLKNALGGCPSVCRRPHHAEEDRRRTRRRFLGPRDQRIVSCSHGDKGSDTTDTPATRLFPVPLASPPCFQKRLVTRFLNKAVKNKQRGGKNLSRAIKTFFFAGLAVWGWEHGGRDVDTGASF